MHETTRLEVTGHHFTYYACSGGVVITDGREVIDAGIIGSPGPITTARLSAFALTWLRWRRDYRYDYARTALQTSNQPATMETL